MDNTTAKVSCFARGYHFRNNDVHIFADDKAQQLLEDCGFRITRLMDHDEMTGQYFDKYNEANPEHKMDAPVGVCYLLAVRTGSKEG